MGMDLRLLLQSAISSSPDETDVRRLVLTCRNIALVFLRKKSGRGRLFLDFSLLNLEDLAWDSVADLFNRDESGALIQIKAYFDGIDLAQSSEEVLLSHLRRLVFSRVNQSIFRIYSEADPGLSKIIRNIKLAIQSLRNFVPLERFGEQCLVPALCDPHFHLPRMERQDLAVYFGPLLSPADTDPEMLSKVSKALREQADFSRVVHVVALAQLFRTVYETPQISQKASNDVEQKLEVEDMENLIANVGESIREEYRGRYVGEKGIAAQYYDSYFSVISQALYRRLIEDDGEEFSLYQAMSEMVPTLTKDDYLRTHRAKLEYLFGLAFKRVTTELRKGS